jgi:hypothetical protein
VIVKGTKSTFLATFKKLVDEKQIGAAAGCTLAGS